MRQRLIVPVIVLAVLGMAAPATADETVADDAVTYVRAGRFVDVDAGEVLADRVLVLRGERVARVEPAAEIEIPRGAQVVDLTGHTVLPGLIDMHVHMTGDHRFHGYRSLGISLPRATLHGVLNARKTIEAGFTSARNVGAGGYADVALRDAIRDGEIIGPRLRVAGPSLGITGGHCDNNLLPSSYKDRAGGVADGPWAVRAKVREVIKYGADVIKFCATGGVLSKGTDVGKQQYSFEEMRALIEEAHQRGRKVAAHAHGTEGIKSAIRAGVDSVEHASLIDDEGIRLAKEHGTVLVMDVYVSTFILSEGAEMGILPESLEKERQVGQVQRDNFRKAHAAGVKMAFGSDAAVYPHGDNAKQFAYMVEYGMTPMEAIQAATVHAAELIDWPDDVGSLAPGHYADLIAVAGDPMADITVLENVALVMQGGRIVKDAR